VVTLEKLLTATNLGCEKERGRHMRPRIHSTFASLLTGAMLASSLEIVL
jgi:hypothetical protein